MRIRLAFLVLSCVSYAAVQGCGGDNGTGNDASTTDGTVGDGPSNGNDASNDVAQQNDSGSSDTGASDGGAADSGNTIGSWMCGTATVSDCAQCIGHTQTCVYCGIADGSALAGNCVQQGTSCFMGAPMGYQTCRCGDASPCPEGDQLCFGARCFTCGEIPETNGQTCENGGKCDSADGGCL